MFEEKNNFDLLSLFQKDNFYLDIFANRNKLAY